MILGVHTTLRICLQRSKPSHPFSGSEQGCTSGLRNRGRQMNVFRAACTTSFMRASRKRSSLVAVMPAAVNP